MTTLTIQVEESGKAVQYVHVGDSSTKAEHDGRPFQRFVLASGFGRMLNLHPDHFVNVISDRDSLIRRVVDGKLVPLNTERVATVSKHVVNAPKSKITSTMAVSSQERANNDSQTVARAGSKKERAAEIYRQESGNKSTTIARFISELQMSTAGATTYFYNCKKGS